MSEIKIQKNIFDSPEVFEKLITTSKKNIICDHHGNFYEQNYLISIIKKIVHLIFRDLFGFEAKKYVGWTKGFTHTFDKIEQSRIEVNKPSFESHIKAFKAANQILKHNKSSKTKEALKDLKLRTTAFKYRLGVGYKDKYAKQDNVDAKLYEDLKTHAETWIKTQIVFKTKELTPKQIEQLETLTRYPKFAVIVKDDEILRHKFFDWALLANNNVDAFVQYPKTVEKIIDVGLSERIGRYGGNDLQIEEVKQDEKLYKELTLPFEGKRENILDGKHVVTLSHEYKLSIAEIFKIYKDREGKVGNVEYFGEGKGTINWNSHAWGPFNPAKNDYEKPDMNDSDWIKKIQFSEIITEEEAKERFEDEEGHKLQFSPDDFICTIIANNQYEDANLTGSHTRLGIAVPLGNGKRGLTEISKFSRDFPLFRNEKIRYLLMAYNTVEGALQLPDENFYQIRRDEEGISFKANEAEARSILQSIGKDKLKMENKSLHFQLLTHNCTDWVFKKFKPLLSKEKSHEIAGMNMWDAKPEGFSKYIVKLPSVVRKALFNLSLLIIRPNIHIKKGKNGRIRKIGLHFENAPWKDGITRLHPSRIIRHKRTKKAQRLAPVPVVAT